MAGCIPVPTKASALCLDTLALRLTHYWMNHFPVEVTLAYACKQSYHVLC